MNQSLYTDPHQKKLLKKWGMILESGTPIQDEQTKVVLAQVLENTRNYYIQKGMLNEAGVSQADIIGNYTRGGGVMKGANKYGQGVTDGADYYLPNIVMPMLRRIMPDLIANELVSVQPLNGPIGFALAFRPTLKNPGSFNGNLTVDNEIGYNPVDTRWTGISATLGTSATDPEAEAKASMWNAYAGDSWLGQGADLEQAEWASLNGFNYNNGSTYAQDTGHHIMPQVSFGLMKSDVVAKTRKLAAHWSPELAEDMQAMHGIDVEREMVNTLTFEVGAEIDRQLVTEMVKAAIVGGSTTSWSPVSADGLDQMGRLATLLTQITIEANNIAIKTKRGNANFVITTPRVCALLEQLGMNKFTSFKNGAAIPSVPDTGVGALTKVGLINNDQQLLIRDAYTQAHTTDYLVMGYKGKQIGDSGIIYMPYIPLQLSKIQQPDTLSYSIAGRTRYGIMNNPWEAKNYYTFMKIDTCTNGYKWGDGRQFIYQPSDINALVGRQAVMPRGALA